MREAVTWTGVWRTRQGTRRNYIIYFNCAFHEFGEKAANGKKYRLWCGAALGLLRVEHPRPVCQRCTRLVLERTRLRLLPDFD